MLDKADKQWIIQAIQAGIEATVPKMLEVAFEAHKKWTIEYVRDYVDFRFDELTRMVAKGFEQCATKEELRGVETRLTARIDSLETRVAHLEQTVVTKDYFDERIGIIKIKDAEVHKQLKLHSVLIVDELRRKKIIGPKRANTLVSLQPFPQKLS